MSAPPILRGESLTKSYRLGEQRVEALTGLDIEFAAGEFTALEGPSGSGKTTLLNVLGLLDRPDAGTLSLDGEDAAALDERARSRVRLERFGFVFQTFNLIPVLSARENVEYPMAVAGVDRREREERAFGLLASVGIPEKKDVRPDLLSGGQRQRVAIARALANSPEIVFADEPTANLDSHTAAEILELMRMLNDESGVAFLFATHDPRVVERARRVVTIRDGRIVAERRATAPGR
jgi:putative ABC transport system ATP-binding protein